MDIPVFINVYNLLTWPKAMAEYLANLPTSPHHLKIYFIDNGSTYEPLLDYYDKTEHTVIRLGQNLGAQAPWKWGHISEHIPGKYYIVTDPDLDLSGIPTDVIDVLYQGAEALGTNKCGLSLEIEDLPDTEVGRRARDWESRFWRTRAGNGFWRADIDTTFALTKIGSSPAPGIGNQVRADRPYTAKHLPWYLEKEVPLEFQYYLSRCNNQSSWGNVIRHHSESVQMKSVKQQNKWLAEQFVDLEVDLHIDGNVASVTKSFDGYDWGPAGNLKVALQLSLQNTHKIALKNYDQNSLCVVKTKASMKITDKEGVKRDYPSLIPGKYTNAMKKGDVFPPVVLADWRVLSDAAGREVLGPLAYNLDGMNRLYSAADAGKSTVDVFYVMRRKDLSSCLDETFRKELQTLASQVTWFGAYQEISEVGFVSGRRQLPRYTNVYNFGCLRDQVVADFGCNLGQACVEAAMCGAKMVHGFEYSQPCVDVMNKYGRKLGLSLQANQIDFNQEGWKEKVLSVTDGWDWLLFLAVYRTKEIKDIKDVFQFLVKHTRKGIFFEGHADPRIDTPAYYDNVFRPFGFKSITALGHSDNRPAYKIEL